MIMRVLHLTIKKRFFYMIKSGFKPEEYREDKDYWIKRLFVNHREYFELKKNKEGSSMFTHVQFYNGWAASTKYPNFLIELKGYRYGTGKLEWGAEPGKEYFVIKLGEIIK